MFVSTVQEINRRACASVACATGADRADCALLDRRRLMELIRLCAACRTLRQCPQLARCQPPSKTPVSRSDRPFKMNEAGACLFEREPGAGLAREQRTRNQAEMRLVADTHHHGVSRQCGEQSEERARCRFRHQCLTDSNRDSRRHQALQNLCCFTSARQRAEEQMRGCQAQVAQSSCGAARSFDSLTGERAVVVRSGPSPAVDCNPMSK